MPTELTDWNEWLNEANGKSPQPSSVPPVTKQETDWNAWLNGESQPSPPNEADSNSNEAPGMTTTRYSMTVIEPSGYPEQWKPEHWKRNSKIPQFDPTPEPRGAIADDRMAVGGLLQIGGGQNTGEAISPAPQETPRGAMTPFFDVDKAIAGDYGEKPQRAYERAKKAVDSGRAQRFQWSGLVADTPEDERNLTLLAITQLSAKRGEYENKGVVGKMATGVSRRARQFKTAVDNTLGEAVEMAFGKTKIPGVEVVDGWGDSERLFEKAAESAAEQGDPLVNPNDPWWEQLLVKTAEMIPDMAAGVVTGLGVSSGLRGAVSKATATTVGEAAAAGVWFPPLYDEARDELLSAGVDPVEARRWGAASAIVQAAIETFNLNPFKPKGSKTPGSSGHWLLNSVKDYLVGVSKETGEEFGQGGVDGLVLWAATKLDEMAPDVGLGQTLLQKFGEARQSAGPIAVMMLPGFIGGLPASRRESVARRWMANNPQERVERVAEKAAEGKPISRSDVPEVKDAAGRAALGEEVAKAKPRYRWNPKTGKLEPKIADSKIQPGPLSPYPNTIPGKVPQQFNAQSLSETFGLPQDQAEATVALAESMGLDTSQIELVKGGEPGAGALAQSAKHVSPHTFDKFSMDKIGTGEGAQAYGWGLYFATRDSVIDWYKKNFENRRENKPGLLYNDRPVQEAKWGDQAIPEEQRLLRDEQTILNIASEDMAVLGAKTVDDLINQYDDKAKSERVLISQHNRLMANTLRRYRDRLSVKEPKPVRVYEVDLAPSEDEYLLWDKPLSEQPKKVKDAIRDFVSKNPKDASNRAVLRQLSVSQTTPQSLTGRDFYRGVTSERGRAKDASSALRSIGIRGIKYLDGTSRGKGEGSHNYVLFDDADVTIKAMYQGKKASVEFLDNGKALIRALESPDVSSGVHELAHIARRTIFDRNLKPEERAGITDEDIAVAEKWSGAKDGKWTRKAEERFARGFEKYLRDGKAPTKALGELFAKMKQWLSSIYTKLAGSPINVRISPEMRTVYDKLVTRGVQPSTQAADTIRPPAPGFGRPELANPGVTQEARDAIDAIDQGRKEAGVPETLPNAVVEERATELIQNDYEGQVSRILNNREEPNPEVSEVARQLINTESEKAMNGDVDAWERRSELGHALRERRTDVARELQIGYDRILGPKERQQHVKTSATELPEKLQNKIDKLAAPERKLRKRSIDADIAIDDAWKRLGAAFGGNLGSNLGNLPEAAKAAGDLVVAYARKGVYVIEDIIADLEANRGQKLGAQVRQQLRDAATSRKDEIRVARVENENAQSDASRKKRERNQKKIKAELSKHAEKMQRWKDDLKRLPGWEIDVDKPEGLSVVEADVALQYLQAFIGGNFAKFLEWQRFVMLSAFDSQFVNAIGNAQNLMVIFGGRYPLEWLTAAARGQANVHEFIGTYRALLNPKNLLRSAHNGWRAFKTESDIYEVEQAARPKSSSADYHGNGLYIRGRKGRVLRAVGGQRGLLSMDNVAKSLISDAFVTMYANRVAVQEGFNPKTEPQAYDERVQQLIDNHESQAWKLATDAVHEATLQEKGWVLKRVLEAANDGPGQAIRLFLPFITTPWNVPKFVLRHTPGIGTAMLAADIYRGDKAAINRDIAAQIMGFIGMAWFAAYNDPHDEDKWLRFTGTENASYRRKTLVSASKHKPYHMYLFGQPVDLRRFDPIATWIAVAVDTTQALKGAETADDYTQAVKAYTTSVAKAMRDKTWLQTISDMIELFTRLSQDDGSGESFNRVVEWAAKFSSDRLVPNLWRSISRDMDAYQKDTRLHGKGEQRQERLKDVLRIRAGFDTADDEIVYDLWSYPMSMRDLDDAPVTNMPWRILDFALRQVSALPMASQPPFIGTDILMQWNIENPNDPYWPGEPGLKWSNADGEQVQMTPEQKAQFLRLSGLYARYKVQAWADAGKFNDIDKLTTKDRDKIKQYITEGRSKARRSLSARWRKGETPTDDEIMNLYWFPDSTEAD